MPAKLDFNPLLDGPAKPAGTGAAAVARTPALDFDPWSDTQAAAPSSTPASATSPTQAAPPKDRPGFGETFGDAIKRGAASAVASTAHAVSDFVDQTIQAPIRTLGKAAGEALGVTVDAEAAREMGDPLGARAAAETNLAVEKEINADRATAADRIGARPTVADIRANPVEAAQRQALRLTNAAGESVPLLAAAIATRNPQAGAAAMGAATGAQEFTDLRAEGLDRGEAAQAAALTGAVESAGERLGLGAVLGAKGAGSMLRAAVKEGAQEVPVSVAQTNIADQARGRETPVADQLLDAVDAGLVGGALGAGGHLVGARRGESPQVQALREQADRLEVGGPISRGAAEVVRAQADHLHTFEQGSSDNPNNSEQFRTPDTPRAPFGGAAPSEGQTPPRTATQAADVIDQHVAHLRAAAADGGMSEQQRADTEAERMQLDARIRDHLRRREEGVVGADPAADRETAAQLPELEQRRAELDRALERHKLATARGVQLQRLQARLERIDADADLIALADQLQPGGQRNFAQTPGATVEVPATPAADGTEVSRSENAQPDPAPMAATEGEFSGRTFHDQPAPSPVATAAAEAATSPSNDLKDPSQKQRDANNFKVGRQKINGLDVSIEYPPGVKRKAEHSRPLAQAYGYIRRTEGADGEKFDVFLGDRADDTRLPVFVVDQKKADGSFDESKGMLGFQSEAEARAAYLSNYPKGWEQSGFGGIRQFTQDEFKAWVKDSAATRKPAEAPGLALDRAQRLAERFTKGWGSDAPRVVLARNAGELRRGAGLAQDAEVSDRA